MLTTPSTMFRAPRHPERGGGAGVSERISNYEKRGLCHVLRILRFFRFTPTHPSPLTMTRGRILIAAIFTTVVAVARADTSPLLKQSQSQADAKSAGCLSCHAGIEPMHASAAVKLACTDCHGGNGAALVKQQAHIQPRNAEL